MESGRADVIDAVFAALRGRAALTIGLTVTTVGAILAPGAPTGSPFVDALMRVAIAVAFVLLAIDARSGTRLVAAAVVTAASLVHPTLVGTGAACVAQAFAMAAYASDSANPSLGVAAGVGIGQAALRLGWSHPAGASAVIATAALLILLVPALRGLPDRDRKIAYIALAGAASAAIVCTGLLAVSALAARSKVHDGVDATRVALDASRRGDNATAARAFDKAQRAFADAHRLVDAWWNEPARVVPVAARYRSALTDVTASGADLAATGAQVAHTTNPDVTLSHGRVSIAAVRALEPPLATALTALERNARRLEAIDTTWLVPPISTNIRELDRRIDRGITDAETGIEAARVLPALLGADGTRHYFVAFQTPAEQRARGGIIGNYAVVSFDNGRFDLDRRGRDTDLNDEAVLNRKLVGPADYVRRYNQFDVANTWQNVTMSPDFPSVAQVIEHLYPQSGGTPVDGVVTLDPRAVAAILSLTGPVRVADLPFALTAENAEHFLLEDQYTHFQKLGDRVDFLGEAIDAIVHKFKTVKLPSPSRIADVLGPIVREGRLALHSTRPDEERLFTTIGADGAFPPVNSDFVALVTQNASGNKIDVFQRRSLHDDVVVSPSTGEVTADVTVTLYNDAPRTNLPHYVIGGSGPTPPADGNSRIYVSLYSPLTLQQATVGGKAAQLEVASELGRNVFSAFVLVPSHGSTTLRLRLRGRVDLPDVHGTREYSLDVWRQPTIRPDGVEVRVSTARGALSPGSGLRRDGSALRGTGLPTSSTTYLARFGT